MRFSLFLLLVLTILNTSSGQNSNHSVSIHGGWEVDKTADSVDDVVLPNGNFGVLVNQTTTDDMGLDIYLHEVTGNGDVVSSKQFPLEGDQRGFQIIKANDLNELWIVGITERLTTDNYLDIILLRIDADDFSVLASLTYNLNRFEKLLAVEQTDDNIISLVRRSGDNLFGERGLFLTSLSVQSEEVVSNFSLDLSINECPVISFIRGESGNALLYYYDTENELYTVSFNSQDGGQIHYSGALTSEICPGQVQREFIWWNGLFEESSASYIIGSRCGTVMEVSIDGVVVEKEIEDVCIPYLNDEFVFIEMTEDGFNMYSRSFYQTIIKDAAGEYFKETETSYPIAWSSPRNALAGNAFIGYKASSVNDDDIIHAVSIELGVRNEIDQINDFSVETILTAFNSVAKGGDDILVTENSNGQSKLLYYNTFGILLDSVVFENTRRKKGPVLFGLQEVNGQARFLYYKYWNTGDSKFQLLKQNGQIGALDTIGSFYAFASSPYGKGGITYTEEGDMYVAYSYIGFPTQVNRQDIVRLNNQNEHRRNYNGNIENQSVGTAPFLAVSSSDHLYVLDKDYYNHVRISRVDFNRELLYTVDLTEEIGIRFNPTDLMFNAAGDKLLIGGELTNEEGITSAIALEIDAMTGMLISEHVLDSGPVFPDHTKISYKGSRDRIAAITGHYAGDESPLIISKSLRLAIFDESFELLTEQSYYDGFYELPKILNLKTSDVAVYAAGHINSISKGTTQSILFSINIDNDGLESSPSELETNVIQVFPNPATKTVNLCIESSEATFYDLILYNNKGQVVLSEKGSLEIGRSCVNFNMNNLPPNTYFVQLITSDGIKTERIIKI